MKFVHGSQMIGIGKKPMSQRHCETADVAWRLITKHWDSSSLFASYPFRYNSRTYRTEYYINTLWFDLDSIKIENAFLEFTKLRHYANLKRKDCGGIMTEFGIHAHLFIEPVWISSGTILADIKKRLIRLLGLRTVDWQVLGDLTKLPRLPNSYLSPGKYAIQIYPDEFWQDALNSMGQRRPIFKRRSEFTLAELARDLDAVEPASKPLLAKDAARIDVSGVSVKVACEVFEKLCVRRYMSLDNPPSYMRWLAGVLLRKKFNWNTDEIVDWFASLGIIDFNRDITRTYVGYSEKYPFSSSCQAITEKGFCLEDECPFSKKKTGGH